VQEAAQQQKTLTTTMSAEGVAAEDTEEQQIQTMKTALTTPQRRQ
jgi:hypothetical protein